MSSYMLGMMLRDNLMDGRPSRMKGYSDYTGLVIPPCGEFASSSAMISPPPWMPAQADIGFTQRLTLHREIEHFMAYMKPSHEESALRKDLIARFTRLVRKLAPATTVRAVGSCVTGLYFPTSDVDMVVTFNDNLEEPGILLARLEDKIRSSGFPSKIEAALHASTPFLRCTDGLTGIDVYLTAEGDVGRSVKATMAVGSWTKKYDTDLIRSLVMVLKLFLSIRRLASTATGGIDSYLLVWMVIAWVELGMPNRMDHQDGDLGGETNSQTIKSSSSTDTNTTSSAGSRTSPDLGTALLGFLRFYGEEFDYANKAVYFSSSRGVRCSAKSSARHRNTKSYLLAMSDPADPKVDMGAKVYGIKHVRETFRDAYVTMLALVEGTATRDELVKARFEGALGSVLGGDYAYFISKRKRILGRWRRAQGLEY